MAGLLGGMFGDNPIYNAFDQRRNAVSQLGLGLMQGKNWQEGLSQGVAGALDGRQRDDAYATTQKAEADRLNQINQTVQYMRNSGGSHWADAVEIGGMSPADAYNGWFQEQAETAETAAAMERNRRNADFIQDPELRSMVEAGAMDFQTAYKYEKAGAEGGVPGLGQTIYTGRDESENIIPMQVGDDGRFHPTQLPEGVNFDPGAMNAERAAGAKYGAGTGQTAFDLPAIEAQTEFAINNLNNLIYQTDQSGQVMTDQLGRPVPNQGMQEQFGTGWFGLPTGQVLPAMPNTEKANFQARKDQIQGQAFLQAVESLKGSGAVSEIEGMKATQAIIRAQTSQTEAEFVKAVQEAIAIYERGLANARAQAAGTQFTGGAGQQAPTVSGDVDAILNGYGI